MHPTFKNSIKRLVSKNGIATFATIFILAVVISGISVVAVLAGGRANTGDGLTAIILFCSSVGALALFSALAAIIDRQNVIMIMMLIQHNPEAQEELLSEIKAKNKVLR